VACSCRSGTVGNADHLVDGADIRLQHSVKTQTHSLLIQAVFGLAIVGMLAMFATSAQNHLAREHIANGFDFLWMPAGWDVGSSLITHSDSDPYWRIFLVGLLNTLLISAICIVLATVLGFLLGFLASVDNPLIAGVSFLYINTVRNIPQILQVFFWYHVTHQLPPVRQSISLFDTVFLNNRGLYAPQFRIENGLPWLMLMTLLLLLFGSKAIRDKFTQVARNLGAPPVFAGIALLALIAASSFAFLPIAISIVVPRLTSFDFTGGLVFSPEFVALNTAIVLYNIAFIAEIVRAGIRSVPRGQTEVARSLGLSSLGIFLTITLPQALRLMIPPLTNQYISIAKSTSLGVAIGYSELFSVVTIAINHTGQSFENIAILMTVYLTLSVVLSGIGEWLSWALRWPGR